MNWKLIFFIASTLFCENLLCQSKVVFVFDDVTFQSDVTNIIDDSFPFLNSKKIKKRTSLHIMRSDLSEYNIKDFEDFNDNSKCSISDKTYLLEEFKKHIGKQSQKSRIFIVESENSNSKEEVSELLQSKIKDKKNKNTQYYVYFKTKDKERLKLSSNSDYIQTGEKVSLELIGGVSNALYDWNGLSFKERKIDTYPIKSTEYQLTYKENAACRADTFKKFIKVAECPCIKGITWNYNLESKVSQINNEGDYIGLFPDQRHKYALICEKTCGIESVKVKIEDLNGVVVWSNDYKYDDLVYKDNELGQGELISRYRDKIVIEMSQGLLFPNEFPHFEEFKISLSYNTNKNTPYFCDGEKVTPFVKKVVFSYCSF